MQQYIGEVIAAGIQPPEVIIHGKRKVGKRKPTAAMGLGKHAPEVSTINPFDQRVVSYVNRVVKIDEPAVESRQKYQQTNQSRAHGNGTGGKLFHIIE
jgi:hypothetical protein